MIAQGLWRGRSRLSRITTSGRFIPEIDGLRFVAIATVILYHVARETAISVGPCHGQNLLESRAFAVFHLGQFGVELFFIISGFILALPFADAHLNGARKVGIGSYFRRRLTRLEPPYIVNLVFSLAMRTLVQHQALLVLVPHFLAGLVYQHNAIYGTASPINVVHWSLEIEVQFYVLAPLLALLFKIGPTSVRRAVIVGGAFFVIALQPYLASPPRCSLLQYLQYFLVGFLLADVYLVDWKKAPKKSPNWDLIGPAFWLLVPLSLGWESVRPWLFPAVAFGAYVGVFRSRLLGHFFRARVITTIGGMCYTIYLYHYMQVAVLVPLTSRWSTGSYVGDVAIQTLIHFPLCIGVCAVLFVVFERPFMRRDWPRVWGRRLAYWGRKSAKRLPLTQGDDVAVPTRHTIGPEYGG